LRQETNFPEEERTTLTVRAEKPTEMDLNIRVPYWAKRGGSVKLNGEVLPVFSSASSYLTVKRVWKDGDRLEVELPLSLHIDAMPDDPTIQAAMYGPLILGGKLGSQGLTSEMMYPGYDTAPRATQTPTPEIDNRSTDPVAWIEPVKGSPLAFRTAGQSESTNLIPFYKLAGEKYAVYWKVKSAGRGERPA
jgi:DUF1680 family protein